MDYQSLVDMPLSELVAKADAVRREAGIKRVEPCSIINAKSGKCAEDCAYCAQSAHHHVDIKTYPLVSEETLFEAAAQAHAQGAHRFGIVTSGNRLNGQELDVLCRAIVRMRKELKMGVCGSLGAMSKENLTRLRDAGMSRYHHNIETSRRYYAQIVTTHDFEDRIATIKDAQSVGLSICSGGIIGMGEDWADRIDMAVTLRDLKVEAIPLNILIPIPGTRFSDITRISGADVVRTIAIFRIITKTAGIKIIAGRDSSFKDFQALGYMAGADGMMVGGYLTTGGRAVADDHALIKELDTMWAA
jgi:biotin synthase